MNSFTKYYYYTPKSDFSEPNSDFSEESSCASRLLLSSFFELCLGELCRDRYLAVTHKAFEIVKSTEMPMVQTVKIHIRDIG